MGVGDAGGVRLAGSIARFGPIFWSSEAVSERSTRANLTGTTANRMISAKYRMIIG